VLLDLAVITSLNGCDDHCVADARAAAPPGASWRAVPDTWQWTGGLIVSSAAFVALVGWAVPVGARRGRLRGPLLGASIVLSGVWAVAFAP
jgi:hypothetical protein